MATRGGDAKASSTVATVIVLGRRANLDEPNTQWNSALQVQ